MLSQINTISSSNSGVKRTYGSEILPLPDSLVKIIFEYNPLSVTSEKEFQVFLAYNIRVHSVTINWPDVEEQDLEKLMKYPLESLSIKNANEIEGGFLSSLAKTLTKVTFYNCPCLLSDSLNVLKEQNIQHLELSNCEEITDSSFEGNFKRLVSLVLKNCRRLTGNAIEGLRAPYLKKLSLEGFSVITPQFFKSLRQYSLCELSLENCGSITEGFDLLKLTLEFVNLRKIEIKSSALQTLSKHPVRTMILRDCNITQKGLYQLLRGSRLNHLELTGSSCEIPEVLPDGCHEPLQIINNY